MEITQFTWKYVLDAIPDMISILDNEHRIVWLNKKMLEILELTYEECLGKFCYDLIHERNLPPDYCPYSKFLDNKEEHKVEAYINKLKKSFLVTISPIKDINNNLLGAIHIARDITQIKSQQQELLLSESKFSATFINNPVAMCITKLKDGVLLDVNKAWFNITGYTREEAIKKSIKELNIYANIKDRNAIIDILNEQGYASNFDLKLKNKKGELVYGQMSVSIIIINGDKCGVTTFVDKTEEVKLEKVLHEMEHTLLLNARNEIVQSLKDGVFIKE